LVRGSSTTLTIWSSAAKATAVKKALNAMRQMMDRLKLTVNEEKTRICRVPDGEFAYPLFLDSGSADNQTLWKDCVRCASKPTIWTTASIRRSLAVEGTITNSISREELVRMAIKLRNDLFDYEDKLGSCRDFAELC
jgi:hypothetical protein